MYPCLLFNPTTHTKAVGALWQSLFLPTEGTVGYLIVFHTKDSNILALISLSVHLFALYGEYISQSSDTQLKRWRVRLYYETGAAGKC